MTTWVLGKKLSTCLLALVLIASWIKPIWPMEQVLNDSLAVIGLGLLWKYFQRYTLSDRDYFLVVLFFCAHLIAARWLYSNVPYEKWLQAVFGFTLNQQFGWSRNHFDRLVHFMYGFCFTPAIISWLQQKYRHSAKIGFYIAISAIMITSLWYEWFEWLIALLLSPKDAESYNGQQGDIWDAHKDMLMATIGSVLWIRACVYRRDVT